MKNERDIGACPFTKLFYRRTITRYFCWNNKFCTTCIGSIISDYKSIAETESVIRYNILLDLSPVMMSISSMTSHCRDLYEMEILAQLRNLSQTINYQLCTGIMCSYINGSSGSGAAISDSSSSAVGTDNLMFVAIDVNQLDSAVHFDIDSSTVRTTIFQSISSINVVY